MEAIKMTKKAAHISKNHNETQGKANINSGTQQAMGKKDVNESKVSDVNIRKYSRDLRYPKNIPVSIIKRIYFTIRSSTVLHSPLLLFTLPSLKLIKKYTQTHLFSR